MKVNTDEQLLILQRGMVLRVRRSLNLIQRTRGMISEERREIYVVHMYQRSLMSERNGAMDFLLLEVGALESETVQDLLKVRQEIVVGLLVEPFRV